jgi:hypothetical protein
MGLHASKIKGSVVLCGVVWTETLMQSQLFTEEKERPEESSKLRSHVGAQSNHSRNFELPFLPLRLKKPPDRPKLNNRPQVLKLHILSFAPRQWKWSIWFMDSFMPRYTS